MRSGYKIIGILLVIGGLAIVGLIYAPLIKEEFNYRARQVSLSQIPLEERVPVDPVSGEFGLVIAKIGVNVQVFSDVDPDNPDEYRPVLKQGVAHALNSAFPGELGNVFIFSHSVDSPLNITRYNTVFYLINKLNPGDEILVYYHKELFYYQVFEKKIVPPEILPDYLYSHEGKNLILQTCHPPGTTINRLLVLAREIE